MLFHCTFCLVSQKSTFLNPISLLIALHLTDITNELRNPRSTMEYSHVSLVDYFSVYCCTFPVPESVYAAYVLGK